VVQGKGLITSPVIPAFVTFWGKFKVCDEKDEKDDKYHGT